jgi:dTMP kinase
MTRFIVIEGIDGTGKKTQFDLLVKYIRDNLKKPVLELDFPRYGKPSAMYVERYLNGEYGTNAAPDLASMLYAFDRWQAKPDIVHFTDEHPDGYIVSNRYVSSNLAHQGGKIVNPDKRQKFYDEQMDLEFNQFGIPRPDLNFVLLLPEAVAQKNVDGKAARSYTTEKRDLHEKDSNHLRNAATAYRELINLYPDNFVAIDCWDVEREQMRTIDEIQQTILGQLNSLFD